MINIDIDKYDLIILDIDDTLYSYKRAHTAALGAVLREFNLSIDDYNKAKNELYSRQLKVNHHKKDISFKILSEQCGLSLKDALSMYNSYCESFLKNLYLDKDIYNFIRKCKFNNKKIVAITNYYTNSQLIKLNSLGLLDYIDYLITSEEFETEKPNVVFIDKVIELTNISDKSKMISIGNSQFDSFNHIDFYPYDCNKMLIGICGKSGAGKSTISNYLTDNFNASCICCDGYHLYERNNPKWKEITHYNPTANNLIGLQHSIENIYFYNEATVPIYNHLTGIFDDPININIKDSDFLILEGLHILYPEIANNYLKIKIFIDSDISDDQKIKRDSIERGKTKQEIINSINIRNDDYYKYIYPQKDYSNFLIKVDKSGRFSIKLNQLNTSKLEYTGQYNELLSTIKNIIEEILDGRFIKIC